MAVGRLRKRIDHAVSGKQGHEFDRPILVVEDQDSAAQYLATLIKDRWNCEVLIAKDLRAAKALIKSTNPSIQVAICDLHLPDAQYGEIIDLMNECGIAAIALTGAFGDDLRESLSKKGVVDYVSKGSINAYEYVVSLVGRIQKNLYTSILIVDDALSARALYKHMSELLRFKVFTANNGKEALKILNQHPEISLVVTDYAMPEMDGFELTAKARSKFSKDQLAIIGVSGTSEQEVASTFLKCGANDFLTKAFSYQEFLCRIHQNLDMLDLVKTNQYAAQRDFLTGIHNRRHFFGAGSQIYVEAKKKKQKLIVAMIDLDSFKEINDKHGHDCGDKVIKHFASLLEQHFGKNLIARIGGEEFAALLCGVEQKDAINLFNELRVSIKNSCVDFGDTRISYTASIGLCDQMGDNIDDLVKGADVALYMAKKNGRDQVCVLNS